MTRFFLVVTLAFALPGYSGSDFSGRSDKPLRVLAIGNSFAESVMKYLPPLAKEAEKLGAPKLDIVVLMHPGCTLDQHWANVEKAKDASFVPYGLPNSFASGDTASFFSSSQKTNVWYRNRGNLPQMLKAYKWDIVTIQQGSGKSWREDSYEPYFGNLVKLVHELAPTAEIRIQQTWAYSKDHPALRSEGSQPRSGKWGITQTEMYDKLDACYEAMSRKYGLKVVRTGYAVQEWRRRHPGDPDPVGNGKDTIHLNDEGRYLQALVWVKSLFGVDVNRLAFEPKLGDGFSARAKAMRELVDSAQSL